MRSGPRRSRCTARRVDASARPASWGPWALYPAGSHTRAVVVAELRRLGAPLDVVAESHQPEVLREMVRLGAGWSVLPSAQAEEGPRALAPGRPIATRQLVTAMRASAVRDPAVEQLARQLASQQPGPHATASLTRGSACRTILRCLSASSVQAPLSLRSCWWWVARVRSSRSRSRRPRQHPLP